MNEQKPSWKGCIVFGILNILLVLLGTKLSIVLISTAMILLIITSIAVTAKSVKEDMAAGFRLSALGCVVGLLLQCIAGVLYVFNVVSNIISPFIVRRNYLHLTFKSP